MDFIGVKIKMISNLIFRELNASSNINEEDRFTCMHGWVIDFVKNAHGDVFQRDIETHFKIRRSTVSGIIKLMEANGIITRQAVSYDARLKKIVLTNKAFEVYEKVQCELARIEQKLVKNLSESELKEFSRLSQKLIDNLEKEEEKG